MLLKYFYDETLAQASYLVGCTKTGEALVIDPMRDIQPYLSAAAHHGLRITHIADTHIHADYVSGARELGAATGAMVYLSDMGDEHWKYGYANDRNVILVRDGDRFMVGNIQIDVLYTPGHTLEHIAFVVTDTAAANEPIGVFTGDFMFVGDVGRPDLLEEAAGMVGTKEPGARLQFATLQRFKALPDYLQIWPAHGAGSACGKALGAIPSTTLGYEKRFNPAFQIDDENTFVKWLLDGQPEAPWYFAQMKKVNKLGPALLRDIPTPRHLTTADLPDIGNDAQIIDLRSRAAFTRGHLHGSFSVPATDTMFSTYVGWFVDFNRPVYLVVNADDDVAALLVALRAIGVDEIIGYFTPEVLANNSELLPTISAQTLHERIDTVTILDVRGKTEFCAEHIMGARHLQLGQLARRLAEIPRDRTVITQCASGYRSHIAASWLQAHGFEHVLNLEDGAPVWSRILTTETCTVN
ncbi:MAG: MBL fold metallo-hydrolase [Chloroflexota bacterium]|nr:MBL fold metallo-hydrolase [Chloroflexota bacterium]